MTGVKNLLQNRVLIAAILAWLTSQVTKTILYAAIHRRIDWKRLIGDGGMPSTHSAAVTAAAVACGFSFGPASGIFGLSLILAFITCHDAMNSRQEIGKHAVVLNELTKDKQPDWDVVLKEFVGHTPTQVAVGIIVGLAIGFAVCLL